MRTWTICGAVVLTGLAVLFWGDAGMLGYPRTQIMARGLPEKLARDVPEEMRRTDVIYDGMDEKRDRGWPLARYRLADDDVALARLPIRWPECASERRSCEVALLNELAVQELRANLARMLADGFAACGMRVVALTDLWGQVEHEGELVNLGLQQIAGSGGTWRASATVMLDQGGTGQSRAAFETHLRNCVPLADTGETDRWNAPTGADLTIELVNVGPDTQMPEGPLIEAWAAHRSALLDDRRRNSRDGIVRWRMKVSPQGVFLDPMPTGDHRQDSR